MSANNYIKIEEISADKFRVAEKDYESDLDIQHLGDFDVIRLAIEKAENHIRDIEYEVEYGIRFSLINKKVDSKDFDSWNKRKKEIDEKGHNKFYGPREIWWCYLGLNIGFEEDGTGEENQRPVLVIKGFSRQVCLVIPLTSSTKKNPYHVSLGKIDEREAFAIISQIRLIDTRRFINRIAILDEEKFEYIRKAAKDLL